MRRVPTPAKTVIEPLFPLLAIARLRMETDGDGVTTLIAGAGCPLKCRYCLNKDLLSEAPESVTAQELYGRVKIDDLYFLATGGGVTFGGGESLLHADFISRFRSVCGDDWKIYAETSLCVPAESIKLAASCVDGFIVDVKTWDPDIYLAYTGHTCGRMKENLSLLLSLVPADRIRVRIPLIPDFNDAGDQRATAFAVGKLGIKKTELFDYVIR